MSGKRRICVESWFHVAFRELDMTSLTSGKTSSITSRWALTLILSPSSGATCTMTHSHSGKTLLHSCLDLQRSNSTCRGASWKKVASSYSKEYSCKDSHKIHLCDIHNDNTLDTVKVLTTFSAQRSILSTCERSL